VRAQRVGATPSNINLLFRGGVYGPRETGGAFCGVLDDNFDALADTSQLGSELVSGLFVRNVNHELCHGTQYGFLFGGVSLASRNRV
jgi:hypothetical protein